jgi:prepilin-type N-terminal cleavage/methylation domain-containing protein
MAVRRPRFRQCGFTLIEVLVADTILLVGVLGMVALIDGANTVTAKTKAREGGTSVARSIIEVARSIRYRDLTSQAIIDALNGRPGLADTKPATPGHTIESRGVEYALTGSVCSLDDPADGLGAHDSGGPFCSDGDSLGVGQPATDRNPDDYKRVRVTLDWKTQATEHSITQTSSIINPVGGLGPSVTSLAMPGFGGDPLEIESSATKKVSFTATTSVAAADVNWSVNGDVQGGATGTGTSWGFDWEIERADGEILFHDCNYVIQVDAYDDQGRAGAPKALTVVVNRLAPLKPEGFAGGRNGNGENVDLKWHPNPECDVLGYRVFRSPDAGSLGTKVLCAGEDPAVGYTTKASCLDDEAPPGTLYYRVVAVDTAPGGAVREGAQSTELAVQPTGSNTLPSAPTGVTWCLGGTPGCDGPDGEPAPDGVIVIGWSASSDPDGSVAFYRVYRDGTAPANRHDEFFPGGGALAWFEYAPDGQSHTYRVSAVDDDFGESGLSTAVTAP